MTLREPGYQRLIESSLVRLGQALGGRTMVLFTSYSQLRQTANAVRGALADAGIALYQQAGGASRRQLLENFKNSPKAVLMGTRSFW